MCVLYTLSVLTSQPICPFPGQTFLPFPKPVLFTLPHNTPIHHFHFRFPSVQADIFALSQDRLFYPFLSQSCLSFPTKNLFTSSILGSLKVQANLFALSQVRPFCPVPKQTYLPFPKTGLFTLSQNIHSHRFLCKNKDMRQTYIGI